ncbi:Cuticle protein 14 isoform b [Araneus ventricosus]|uniref:Cuticle protein 14 isoform b n=1 Tax=Araneus ventricosus TaxID=182803 RepID=A0A4Y2CVH7_ARAVE|nr:Cuticle protein 14 isoform b [Araneus ventricosus]
MKILVAFAVISCCQAAILLAPRNPDDVGAAVTFNKQDGIGSYDFGYSEGHPSGASFRRESGDIYGNKVGTFGLKDADGRVRIVRYVADANGFRADVTSNEPGVAPQDPASATINKPAIVPAPVVPVAPAVPVAPIAFAPPPPPPPPAVLLPQPRPLPPPPPPQYNYVYSDVAPVAPPPPPPPPPSYYGPPPPPPPPGPAAYAVSSPVAIPAPPPGPKGPVGYAAYGPAPPPPPPPPPAYYNNLIQGKGYVSAVRNYGNFAPPYPAAPPRFGYLSSKPPLQPLVYPL